ncbi:sigma 54-interacting transcriptional regulator [Candidatus Poribacteria bacterium]|nr:sigma 54-interacting transcriptional regulator [Candidatus Poribacteria bacterium]
MNHLLRQYAREQNPVFITGEHGTEKAFAAKILHHLSDRAAGPLYKVSISWKVPEELAPQFLQCVGGSLVLQLQRELSVEVQYTILEMATDRSFTDPLSGQQITGDVRLVLTAGSEIDEMACQSKLLPELVDLLNRRRVVIPPIRERPEDIPALVRYATQRARETGRSKTQGADAQVLALFRLMNWPGNAEDLLLVTAEAAINTEGELITIRDLPEQFMATVSPEIMEQAREVRLPRPGGLKAQSPSSAAVEKPKEVAIHSRAEVESAIEESRQRREAIRELSAAARRLAENPEIDSVVEEALAETAEPDAHSRRVQRLITLAKRLNAQSKVLARQMSGPLDLANIQEVAAGAIAEDMDESLSVALEQELDRGLDAIMSLRRQLSLLNRREQNAISTARDLYKRLILAGHGDLPPINDSEIMDETEVLADNLKELDSIIQRVSGSFPRLGEQIQANLANVMKKAEDVSPPTEESHAAIPDDISEVDTPKPIKPGQ